MKKHYLIYIIISLLFLWAQKNYAQMRGINFQAVAIDDTEANIAGLDITSAPIENKAIKVRFTILDSGATGNILYVETHTTYTDQYGLFSVVIGDGTVGSASPFQKLVDLPWSTATQFLKVEIDIHNNGAFK
ncbi:MAG: hypothetical protein WBM13_01500, partial [Bacteroidia bacterium]